MSGDALLGLFVAYDDNGQRYGIVYRVTGGTLSIADALARPIRRHQSEVEICRPAMIKEINRTLAYARQRVERAGSKGKHGRLVVRGLLAARKARQETRRSDHG